MVSTDKLRLLSALSTGTISKFEPNINDRGHVEYPEAQEILDEKFDTPRESFDLLADLGFLEKIYIIKVYVCPTCQEEGMQYITACPHCEDTHTSRTTFLEHDQCGYMAPPAEFETDEKDRYHCPDCNSAFDSSKATIENLHLCQECGERFANPNHRLWCRDCFNLHPPEEARENILYEYTLTEEGENWHENQITARELLAEQFDSRGFDVDIDSTVRDEEGSTYPIHIYAEDDLLDERIVADVHSTIDPTDIEYIDRVAQRIDARPLLLTTDTTIPDDSIPAAQQSGLTILWIGRDGSIKRLESFDADRPASSNIVDRLATAVNFSSWK